LAVSSGDLNNFTTPSSIAFAGGFSAGSLTLSNFVAIELSDIADSSRKTSSDNASITDACFGTSGVGGRRDSTKRINLNALS
jgi:hypothetical protein